MFAKTDTNVKKKDVWVSGRSKGLNDATKAIL